MGSGKSTIGTGLAARLGMPFHDNDHLLALRTGRTARAIENDEGLDALHRFEAAVLVAALDDPRPSVIAAAAGAVLEPEVAAALAAHDVVYLSVSPDGHRDRAWLANPTTGIARISTSPRSSPLATRPTDSWPT